MAIVADLDGAIRIVVESHFLAIQSQGEFIGLQQIHHAIILNCEAFDDYVQLNGTTRSKLLRKIIREFINEKPDLLDHELEEFKKATRQVMAIGRNLNQITRVIVYDYNKITLNSDSKLALGIAGNTQEHYYTPEIRLCANADEGIRKIRRLMDNFLRIHDRRALSRLSTFMKNQSIASFFDESFGSFFTYTYSFSPVETQNRLYRAENGVKILHAGSGTEHF